MHPHEKRRVGGMGTLWYSFNVQMISLFEVLPPRRHLDSVRIYELHKQRNMGIFFFMRIYGRRNWVDSCIRKTNWIFSIESSWRINSRKPFCHCVNTVLVKMTGTVLVLHKANKKWALERGCVKSCTNALCTCLLPTSTCCVIDVCL